MTASIDTSLRGAPDTVTRAITASLREAGVSDGDTIMVHADLGAIGDPPPSLVVQALRAAVGPAGTIVVPTYTFSFCHQDEFDVGKSPTPGGPWSPSPGFLEFFRLRPGVVRSIDPIHSVAAEGPDAGALVRDLPATCFGPGSVFARLIERNALIVMIGLALEEATLRHHSEEMFGVPFRFRKLFTGHLRDTRGRRKLGWVYSVRLLAEAARPDGSRLEAEALARGLAHRRPLLGGDLLSIRSRALHRLTLDLLRNDAWATAHGPAGAPVELERARVAAPAPVVPLSADADMGDMIESLWRLPRDIVSDGYDAALAALGQVLPMQVHQYPTGLECWSWIVPEKWTCHEAVLASLDGRVLLSAERNPLHVVSYSLPFEGEVDREQLLQHLHVHPRLPDAVPFVFKYYERDWGLCSTRLLRDTLTDARYRVRIRSEFSAGTLKVGEVVVPGRSPESIVFCAHLCHPAMVNDDLTGVVVGVDVMRALRQRPTPRYTYRLLIVPETIGSVAYLSQQAGGIAHLRGGLFLEMLGRDIPHALQLSFQGSSEVDLCLARALRRREPDGWTTPFRTLAGNDERQFNAPGVRVPMLSLTRQLPPSDPEAPYREYHSSADTPDKVPPAALAASRDLVLAMVDELECNVLIAPAVPGEIFCSRYGIHVDFQDDPDAHKALFDILFLVDGTRSVADIADLCGIPGESVERVVGQLRKHGLVREVPCAS